MHRLLRQLGDIYDLHTLLKRRTHQSSYRATRLNDGLEVCIKVVYEPAHSAEQLLARMEREARLLQQLQHRGVAQLLDFGSDDGASFIATRWLDGHNLRTWRLQAPSPQRIHRLSSRWLDTLADVHHEGIAHRDLHPGNVVVTARNDTPMVIDFGLSRRFESGGRSQLTATLQMLGSPRYMSPEQACGEPIDGAADVFAVGCILWELIAGQAPWRHEDPVQAALLRLQQPLPSLRDVGPRLSPPEYAILSDMLALDPRDRLNARNSAARWSELARPRARWRWPQLFPLAGRMY